MTHLDENPVSRFDIPVEFSDSSLISGLTERINRLNDEKTLLHMQMGSMSQEYQTALGLLNTELQKYALQVKHLTNEKHEREVDVRKYVEAKKEEIHLVVTEMDELNKENQALRNKSDKTISSLRNEITELQEQLKVLRRADAEHTNTILQLKAENSRLVSQTAILQSQKSQLQEQNAQLLAQNAKAIEGLSKKVADYKQLKGELERTRSQSSMMSAAPSQPEATRSINGDASISGSARGLSRKKSSESIQASVVTHRSGMTEAEEVEHALLLSKQESEFHTNMYDSLTSADAARMAEYRSRGFSRSQAALMIFEEKFGRSSDHNPSMVRISYLFYSFSDYFV